VVDLKQLIKGAPDGHEFYGNQWVTVASGAREDTKADLARLKAAVPGGHQHILTKEGMKAGENKGIKEKGVGAGRLVMMDMYLGQKEADLVNDYVRKDVKPIGAVQKALDAGIARSRPIAEDTLSYRGMVVPAKDVAALTKAFESGKEVTLNSSLPSSYTSNESVAGRFAAGKMRGGSKGEAVVLEVLMPKGSQVGSAPFSFNIPAEHLISSNSRLRVLRVTKGARRTKVQAVLLPPTPPGRVKKSAPEVLCEEDWVHRTNYVPSIEVSSVEKVKLASLL
jgi:hypothetical protein